jgi:colanic acid/amylovoran biosynthesis glycosyltransferase
MKRPPVTVVMHGAPSGVPGGDSDELIETGPHPSFAELNAAAAKAGSEWILFGEPGAPWPAKELDAHLRGGEPSVGAIELHRLGPGSAGGLLVRASAFGSVGGFFEDVRSGVILDLLQRLEEVGWEVRRSTGSPSRRPSLSEAFREGAARLWLSRRHGGPRMPSTSGIAARAGALSGSNRLKDDRRDSGTGPRVVVWTDAYPARSETFIYNEVNALRELGWSVRAESAARPTRIEQDARRQIRVDYLEDESPFRSAAALARLALRHPLRCLADLRARDRWTREEETRPLRALAPAALRITGDDHVHVHFLAGTALSAMRVCRITGTPFTAVGHGYDVFERPANLQEKLETAAIAIAPCEYTAEHLRRVMRGPEPRVEVIVMGVDPDRFRRTRPVLGGRRVIAVGRLVEKKGFHNLIKAAAILSAGTEPLERVTVVGDGPLKPELQTLAESLGIGRTVEITDAWGADAVASLLEDSDLLVMPAVIASDGDRDAMPVVVKEAMAMELPVVASDEVGLPELVTPEWGRLVPPGDAEALAAAIDELLSLSLASRRDMGSRGRAHVVANCSTAAETKRLAGLFREVKDAGAGPRLRR